MGNQACGGSNRRDSQNSQTRKNTQKFIDPNLRQIPQEGESSAVGQDRQVRQNLGPQYDQSQQRPIQIGNRVGAKWLNRENSNSERQQPTPKPSNSSEEDSFGQGAGESKLSLSYWASLQNEASNLLLHDKNSEALLKFTEALDIQRSILGNRHPDIALTLNNLGVVSRACGKMEDALSFFQQAADICDEVMHLFTFQIMANGNSLTKP
jgi:tetratricopeptide (TPR) repeat protein